MDAHVNVYLLLVIGSLIDQNDLTRPSYIVIRTTIMRKPRGGSRISGKGVHIYKGVQVHFADFTPFYFNIP